MNYIFVDTETTGLLLPSPAKIDKQPFITEIFCLKTDEDFNIIDEYSNMFKVPFSLDPVVVKITGITDQMLRNKNTFVHHYEEIANFFVGSKVFVAHNAMFDKSMIANELIRIDKIIDFPWPPITHCTVEKSMSIKGHRLSLQKLGAALGFGTIGGAHRSKNDVMYMAMCYKKLKENGFIQ